MDILMKNPQDPKYNEMHDGEYEYWPIEAPIKTKESTFPAAVVNGLGMLAAAAAAAVLAVSLLVMYAGSTPRAIYQDSAVINVKIYNNSDAETIYYLLFTARDMDLVEQGTLRSDEDILHLQELQSGTEYVVVYETDENGQRKKIGDFRFRTDGEYDGDQHGLSPTAATNPTETETTEATTAPTETTVETTQETTVETTEETTLPIVVIPPTPTNRATEPSDEESEATKETTEETTKETTVETTTPEEQTKPGVEAPAIIGVDFAAVEESGSYSKSYFVSQIVTFYDLPQDETYTVTIQRDGDEIDRYIVAPQEGKVNVELTTEIPVGESADMVVTVTGSGGTTLSESFTIDPPAITGGTVSMTHVSGNQYRVDVKAEVDPGEGWDMYMEVMITCFGRNTTIEEDPDPVLIPLTKQSQSSYTGSAEVTFVKSDVYSVSALVRGIWDEFGALAEDMVTDTCDLMQEYEVEIQ